MHVHILGICGTFMAGIARLAREQGHVVTGADRQAYPPMSTQLEQMGIAIHSGYDEASLDRRPDLVVVGNAMTRGMPVIERLLNERLPYLSGPAWLAREVLAPQHVLAVSGTHGKTTTSALLAWILQFNGLEPGFLIGGAPGNFDVSARMGGGRYFVVEADEYDTAFFDKRAKLVHYPARTVIIGNLEHDHADIYPDLASIQRQFHHWIRQIPGNACLIVPAADANIDETLAQGCWTRVTRIGMAQGDTHTRGDTEARLINEDGSVFEIWRGDTCLARVEWPVFGKHNVANALAAIVAGADVGVPIADGAASLATFVAPARRQQLVRDQDGVHVFLDFAHHPSAVSTTIDALRARFGGRVLVVLEPRSNTMRAGTHVQALHAALCRADAAWVLATPDLGWNAQAALADASGRIRTFDQANVCLGALAGATSPGDTLVIMSNGDSAALGQQLNALLDIRFAATR
jgi:UDP-N-acetylmuramate: L-alanyl-gamma-D-glutamyl-meso-diaminopimelate ligase